MAKKTANKVDLSKMTSDQLEQWADEQGFEPLTLERAKRLTWRDTVYQKNNFNAKGEPKGWRVNGQVKTWKRSPERVQVPIKYGLYAHDYVTEDVLHLLWVRKEEKSEG